jgi:hypothetical protein
VASNSVNRNLTFDRATQLIIDHVNEREQSICITCGWKIESIKKADAHRRCGHAVVDYCDTKAHQVVN